MLRSTQFPGHRLRHLALVLSALVLAACSVAPEGKAPSAQAPRGEVMAPSARSVRYVVDDAASDIRFIVRKGGTLARLGHNHVIRARDVEGAIALADDPARSVLNLRLPVTSFEVDPPELRAELGEGFDPVPESAVIGTRRNMLGEKVLDAANFSHVDVETVRVMPQAAGYAATLRITLHGQMRDLMVPMTVQQSDRRLTVRARFTVRQSEFGMTPLSVLGGALQVQDEVEVRLVLVAGPA